MSPDVDSPAIPAATLIVVREQASGPPELLMVERAEGMAFAAGALVFPGGRIDYPDFQLAQKIGDRTDAVVTAIRETLEEAAIPVGLTPLPDAQTVIDAQRRLVHEDADFEELLGELCIEIQPFALVPFARWVPKFHAVRRFDTLFFIAQAPAGNWQPHVIEGECAGALWLTAQQALESERRGQARLIFPTRRNLERLAQHDSFEAIRADALAHPIEPVTPWVEERDGEKFITIPAHLGYPVTQERLDGLWRG